MIVSFKTPKHELNIIVHFCGSDFSLTLYSNCVVYYSHKCISLHLTSNNIGFGFCILNICLFLNLIYDKYSLLLLVLFTPNTTFVHISFPSTVQTSSLQ